MCWRNNTEKYGIVSIALHWIMAVAIIFMLALGSYMSDLPYNDPLYNILPEIHRSIGFILLPLLIFRLIWRVTNVLPKLKGTKQWENTVALFVHRFFYLMIFVIILSGYLMSTAKGHSFYVFNWFEVQPIIVSKGLEHIAEEAHELLTGIIIALVIVHVAAAIKHRFIIQEQS